MQNILSCYGLSRYVRIWVYEQKIDLWLCCIIVIKSKCIVKNAYHVPTRLARVRLIHTIYLMQICKQIV